MRWEKIKQSGHIYLAAFVLTLLASLAGRYLANLPGLKVVGAMVLSLLIGMLLQVVPKLRATLIKPISLISNKFLRLGIILLGFKLNLDLLLASGLQMIGLALVLVALMILLTYALARQVKVDPRLSLLVAGGCSICGAAAVMGISPQVDAEADDSVLAVAIVAILGTIFTLLTVALKPFLPLTETQYGVFTGGALHEIAHVVAAAGAGTETSMNLALMMKLSRVLMLAPAALFIGLYYHQVLRHHEKTGHKKLPIPWFMAGFLATSVVGTLWLKQDPAALTRIKDLETLAFIILGMAMAALGLSVNFEVFIKRGHKILGVAVLTSVVLYALAYFAAKLFF